MFIYILRHAWADHAGDPTWPSDAQRPLTEEGRERFARVMPRLVKRGFAPEVIATSPYLRCRQTAETIAEHVEGGPEIVELPALAPHSELTAILRWTREQDVEQMAWVGHSPDIGFLTATLLGDCSTVERFAPGTCAAVRINQGAAEGARQLHWLVAG